MIPIDPVSYDLITQMAIGGFVILFIFGMLPKITEGMQAPGKALD